MQLQDHLIHICIKTAILYIPKHTTMYSLTLQQSCFPFPSEIFGTHSSIETKAVCC